MRPDEELARLLAAQARARLGTFIPAMTPKYEAPLHLTPLLDAIERTRREPVRALVSTPPRHGKTETLLHAIVWLLLQDPTLTIGYATYSADLAKSKSRKARKMAVAAGIQLGKGSKSVQEWRTAQGGGVLAAGVGGSWTGHGINVLFVDDPFKGRKEAESELIRDQVMDWYANVAETRLEPGASAFVVMARWHGDDLIGRLENGEIHWEKVCLAALRGDPPNETALWPKRYPVARLNAIKSQIGTYAFTSLYQGTPTDKLGAVFKRAWLEGNRVDPNGKDWPRSFEYRILSVDGAWQTGVGADYSVIEVWGKAGPYYYLLDVWRQRVELPSLVMAIRDVNDGVLCGCWPKDVIVGVDGKRRIVCPRGCQAGAACIAIEASASGLGAIQMLHRDTALPVIGVPVSASKTLRAETVAPLFEANRVKLPLGAPWLGEWIDEHCSFPNGAHDDQVDATSLGLRRMADINQWGGDPGMFARRDKGTGAPIPPIWQR
jgi:phage terminase large subunit-like protein